MAATLISSWFLRSLALQLTALMPVHALRPMVSYRALELGASALDLGIVAASYALLSLALAIPIGRWVDRIGEQRLLLTGAGTIVTASFLFVVVDNIPTLALIQALLGLGQTTTLIGLQTLTANGGLPEQRDARIGMFAVFASIGQMVGPASAGYLYAVSGDRLDPVFITFGLITLVAAILSISLMIWPPAIHEASGKPRMPQGRVLSSIGEVMRQPSVPHAMLASLTVLTTLDLLTAYLPAYGEANNIRVETIGLLLSLRAGASVASRLAMMPLLRWLGRRRLLVHSSLVSMLGIGAIITTTDPLVLAVLMVAAGFGLGLGQPLSLSWITDQVPVSMRGTAIGVRLFGNRFGQMTVPLAVGAVAGVTGIGAIFVTAALMLGGSAAAISRASGYQASDPGPREGR